MAGLAAMTVHADRGTWRGKLHGPGVGWKGFAEEDLVPAGVHVPPVPPSPLIFLQQTRVTTTDRGSF